MPAEPTDIVFPKNNEEAFLTAAKKLGIRLYFAYPAEKPGSLFYLDEAYPSFAKLASGKNRIIHVRSDPRLIIERWKPQFITGLETISRKDRLNQRNSGLNHIICGIAVKHHTTIILDFGAVFLAPPDKQPVLLGRISQNLRLCRKYKTPFIAATFAASPYQLKSPHDIDSLLKVI